MSSDLRSIRGMHDILPDELCLWHLLESEVRAVLASYGFQEIRVPVLERTEVFTRAIGQATDVVEKEMYTFADRNGESLSLRPEGTAGVVRAALQNGLLYGPTRRLWYAGQMFRHERPQKGRTRQFHQVGAEVFGPAGPDVDAELLAMGERIWKRLGLSNIQLQINSLGTAPERAAYRQALVAYLADFRKDLDEETWARVERNPLRVLDSKDDHVQAILENAPVLPDFLEQDSREHFTELLLRLDRLGIEYTLNPRLVRGLDYYCHTVFEWVTQDLGAQGTICAGGRYDGLVELQGGKPWPATGFAMGIERLVELMRLAGRQAEEGIDAYLVTLGDDASLRGLELAEELRSSCPGLSLVCNPGGGSFKAQFKRADKSGASLALVLAEDEMANNQVSIKHLRSSEPQVKMNQSELAGWISGWLNQQ